MSSLPVSYKYSHSHDKQLALSRLSENTLSQNEARDSVRAYEVRGIRVPLEGAGLCLQRTQSVHNGQLRLRSRQFSQMRPSEERKAENLIDHGEFVRDLHLASQSYPILSKCVSFPEYEDEEIP